MVLGPEAGVILVGKCCLLAVSITFVSISPPPPPPSNMHVFANQPRNRPRAHLSQGFMCATFSLSLSPPSRVELGTIHCTAVVLLRKESEDGEREKRGKRKGAAIAMKEAGSPLSPPSRLRN